jgi:alpha-L-fucosidase
MPDGRIEPRQAEVLRAVGAWLRQYGQSIYRTRGGPFKPNETLASTRRGNTIYLHVLNRNADTLCLPPLQARIRSARVLTGGTAQVQQTPERITLRIAPEHRQEMATILALKLDRSAMDEPALSVN